MPRGRPKWTKTGTKWIAKKKISIEIAPEIQNYTDDQVVEDIAKVIDIVESKNTLESQNPLEAAMAMLITSQVKANEVLNNIANNIEKMNQNMENNIAAEQKKISEEEALRNLEEERAKKPLLKKDIRHITKKSWVDAEGNALRDHMPLSGIQFKSKEDADKFWIEKFGNGNYRIFSIPVVQPRELQ